MSPATTPSRAVSPNAPSSTPRNGRNLTIGLELVDVSAGAGVLITYSAPGFSPSSETLEIHATVDGDKAYFFYACHN